MKPSGFVKTLIIIAGLGLAGLLHAGETTAKPQEAQMTLTHLQTNGITQFVGQEFALRAKVMWEYASVKIPEDPTPADQLRQKASQLTIPLTDLAAKDGKRVKGLFASGADLVRQADPQGREVYYWGKVALSNNDKEYIMTVRLKLRPAFNKTHLANPTFVKQSNNPVYWSQTFEIEIVALREAP